MTSMPNRKLPKNVYFENIRSVFQIMMSQMDLAVLLYHI